MVKMVKMAAWVVAIRVVGGKRGGGPVAKDKSATAGLKESWMNEEGKCLLQ